MQSIIRFALNTYIACWFFEPFFWVHIYIYNIWTYNSWSDSWLVVVSHRFNAWLVCRLCRLKCFGDVWAPGKDHADLIRSSEETVLDRSPSYCVTDSKVHHIPYNERSLEWHEKHKADHWFPVAQHLFWISFAFSAFEAVAVWKCQEWSSFFLHLQKIEPPQAMVVGIGVLVMGGWMKQVSKLREV